MSADLSNLARQPWANAEQSLEANLNNPLRSWDGRDGVGAATARKAMRAYAGAHKMFATSAITALTAQNSRDGRAGFCVPLGCRFWRELRV